MKILKDLDLNNVVFIDIETVASEYPLQETSPLYPAWKYKMEHGREPLGGTDVAGSYNNQAALFAEFGKIVCITIGKIVDNKLKLKTYAVNEDEKETLKQFCAALNNICASNRGTVLCGHAIKGFDIPWLMRRCIVNQIELPTLLDTAHLKPWETTAIDTMDLWKGTGFNGGSLIAISAALGLSNPKDELEGFETTKTYWEGGLEQIVKYCEKDVKTVANIVRKCRYEEVIDVEKTEIVIEDAGSLERIYNSKKMTSKDQNNLIESMNGMSTEDSKIANDILKVVLPRVKK